MRTFNRGSNFRLLPAHFKKLFIDRIDLHLRRRASEPISDALLLRPIVRAVRRLDGSRALPQMVGVGSFRPMKSIRLPARFFAISMIAFSSLGVLAAKEPVFEGLGAYSRAVTTKSTEARRYF